MSKPTRWLILSALLLTATASPALAEDAGGGTAPPSDADLRYEDRIAELERTVGVLAEELERTRADVTVPEESELESAWGLGPGASKIYGVTRGLSMGGYGEAYYRNFVGDKGTARDTADFLRAVIYLGYKFTDNIVFNSEIEIEHTDEIFLEFATLDFMLREWANLRAGLVLMPLGFVNEIHEPPFFYGVNRPDVERFIIPSTWREEGVGLFGNVGEDFRYKLYVTNGLDASGFMPSGLRGGRQNGGEVLAEHLGVSGRLDWMPSDALLLGASFYTGEAGQNQKVAGIALPDARTTIFDVHAQWKWRDLHTRALWAMAFVEDARDLTAALLAAGSLDPGEAIAYTMMGGYAEIAYNVWRFIAEGDRSLEPFYRFEYYDTQQNVPSAYMSDGAFEVFSHTVGLQFKPIPNVVIKADYRNRDSEQGNIADEFNLGVGYVF